MERGSGFDDDGERKCRDARRGQKGGTGESQKGQYAGQRMGRREGADLQERQR